MYQRWCSPPLAIAAIAAGLVFANAEPAQAGGTTIVVTTTADSGVGSLREAITTAQATSDDDTITFDPSVFTSGSLHTITLASQLPSISRPLTIIGPGQDTLAISGNDTTRILFVDQGTNATPGVSIRISDLTLTRGRTGANGGAMYLQRAQVTLTRVTVSMSQAAMGGGAYVHSTGLTVIDSTFQDDTATNVGGAIRSDYAGLGEPYAFVDVRNSVIQRNTAANGGGGIYGARPVLVSNSLITQNTATGPSASGGGVWLGYSFQHQITGTTITSNSARSGGGLVAGGAGWYKGQLSMNDDTVTGNTATSGDGSGGIWIGSSILKLTNSRVSNGAQGNCLPRWATVSGTIWYSNIVDTSGSTVSDGSCSQLDRAILLTSWTASSGVGAISRVQAIADPPFAVGDKVFMCQPNSCNTTNTRTGTVSDVSLADDTFAITADAAFSASSISTGAYGAVWSPKPKILSMSPASAAGAGGTTVTITGAGFGSPSASPTPTVGATFDSVAATSITHVDDTTLIVATPGGTPGSVPVGVTSNAYATSTMSNTMPGAFTYIGAAPTISGVAPATGSTVGGESVVITGSALGGATAVRFGSISASFAINSPTQITATTPASAAGVVDVVVSTSSGDDTEVGAFTYVPPGPSPSPTPAPPIPSGPPVGVMAAAGASSASVTWSAPTTSGSFPVTQYQVASSPDGGWCLSSSTACTVGGLRDGTTYTFLVRALTGAGWSEWSTPSNAVVPTPIVTPTVVIIGSRMSRIVTVSGTTRGFGEGEMATPWARLDVRSSFTQGRSAVPLASDGNFAWQRRVVKGARVEIYFTVGDARSNTLKM